MRNHITLPLLALLAFITFTSAASDWQNAVKCGKRFPNIQGTIQYFCNSPYTGDIKTNSGGMMVPSGWAQEGIGYTGERGNRFRVAVESSCQPAQYLPYKYCMSQFNAMCANTKNKWGYHTQHFGASGCQKFIIDPRSGRGKIMLPSTYCPFTDAGMCKGYKERKFYISED
ncbi:hypothetical protein Q7P35_009174 [Cladosporium inversicolor]